jgi:hypothetical protein
MSFIVATAETVVFRVEISNVVFLQNRPDPNQRDFFYSINFDNFRREDSPVASSPRWEDHKIVFMYSTKFVDQLISKYLTIGINCTHSAGGSTFVGQAVIDLLTLATGPLRVILTTTDGDFPTGKLQLHVDMREVMDAAVSLSECVLSDIAASVGAPSCTLSVMKRSSDEGSSGILPTNATSDSAEFEVPVQRFGLDADMLLDGHCGLIISIANSNGVIAGRTLIDFTHLFSLYSTGSFADAQPSNSSITSMLGDGKKSFLQQMCTFAIARDLTVDGAPDSIKVASMKLILKFDGLPTFCQMREGIVIDGRVWKGQSREGFPSPPFLI